MKFCRELYDSGYNYVKGCSSVMRYLNELILKGGVKRVSLLLAISIDSNHMDFFFFFFMHADALAELVLKRVEDIIRMSFSTQCAICIFYIRSIFVWLS
jgi:SRSO17 transposase